MSELMKQREQLKKRLEEAGTLDRPPSPEKGLKQKMAKLQKSWKAKIDEAESKLAQVQSRNDELLQQLDSISSENRGSVDQFQLAKAQRRIEELTELVEKYKLDCDKKTDVNEQLITDNSNLSARISELTAEKDRLSGTVGEQESVMLEFVEKIEKKEKELVAQLKSTNEVVTSQTDEIKMLKNDKITLTDKMNSLVDCVRAAEKNGDHLKEAIVELEKESGLRILRFLAIT